MSDKEQDRNPPESWGATSSLKELGEELQSAWEDLQSYGEHDGECNFDPPCAECGRPLGRCDKHADAMKKREKRMRDAIDKITRQLK